MSVVQVRCSGCGAPISVSERARFVTCRFCNANLSVQQTDSSIFTELVEEMAADTKDSAKSLRVIELQNDLEQLDREFQMKRESLQVEGKGGKSDPSFFGGIIIMVIAVPFGIFWVSTASQAGAPGFFIFFGVMVTLFMAGSGVTMMIKSGSLNEQKEAYQSRRQRLLREIANQKSQSSKSQIHGV